MPREVLSPTAPFPLPDPPTANQILAVAHGSGEDEILITVSGTPTDLSMPDAFAVSDDGGSTWIGPMGFNLDSPPVVVLLFGTTVNLATLWQVPDPAAWTFADAQPLEAPIDGSIG